MKCATNFFVAHTLDRQISLMQNAFHEAQALHFKMRGAALHHFMHVSAFNYEEKCMTDNILIDLSTNFAIETINLCESIKGKTVLTNQLIRSGTSIGANIHEANYASSKADFISKLQISLKECYETEYWLKIFASTNLISEDVYSKMINQSGKIRRILISSINTAKGNLDK